MPRQYLILALLVALLSFSACTESKKIHINAECGVVMNNLFNKINTEEDCMVQCMNQCSAYDMESKSSTFNHDSVSGCNSCDCVCR